MRFLRSRARPMPAFGSYSRTRPSGAFMRTMRSADASRRRSRGIDMATLALAFAQRRADCVSNVSRHDADTAWAAFMRRDRAWDGRVIGAVKSTGIYCKPSCPARRPKRENVEFFASAEEARSAGYRPCLRCKPDEVGRDREAVSAAVKLIERSEEAPTLGELAEAVGYAPHHFQRLFK